jgi:hypothetical protein
MQNSIEFILEALKNIKGKEWVSIQDLIRLTGRSERSIRSAVMELEAIGLLEGRTEIGEKKKLYRLRTMDPSLLSHTLTPIGRRSVLRHFAEGGPEGRVKKPILIRPRKEEKATSKFYPSRAEPLMDLQREKEKLREYLVSYGEAGLQEILNEIWEREYKERGCPFELVMEKGLIDGKCPNAPKFSGILAASAGYYSSPTIMFRIGRVPIPAQFVIPAAYSIIQDYEQGKVVETYEARLPEKPGLLQFEELGLRGEIPAQAKLYKEIVHYELDNIVMTNIIRKDKHPSLFLRYGALVPGELHPADVLDPFKRALVFDDYTNYIMLKQRAIDARMGVFGVIEETERKASIFTQTIDEIAHRELGWERGKFEGYPDNWVLACLLDEGEYTPIVYWDRYKDIIPLISRRLQQRLGPIWSLYLRRIQEMKTYFFYLGLEGSLAVRYDFPVEIVEGPEEALELRNKVAPILREISWSDPIRNSRIPRVVSMAREGAEKWQRIIEETLPKQVFVSKGGKND